MKNKDLFNNAADEVIEEAWGGGGSTFGGAPAGSPGKFTHTSRSGGKEWHGGSPVARGMTGGPEGFNIKDIAHESEEFAKEAGKNKMYPLETINEYLVNAYLELANAEGQLHSCVKYNKVLTKDEEKKALLAHCYKKVQVVREMIKGLSADIDRVTLS